jgi:hypothetical protein
MKAIRTGPEFETGGPAIFEGAIPAFIYTD